MSRSPYSPSAVVAASVVAGLAAALALDIHLWPLLRLGLRYWRIGILPTASEHLVSACNRLVLITAAAALVVLVLVVVVHRVARRRGAAWATGVDRTLPLVVIVVAYVALGSRLNTAGWYPGFLTPPGILLNVLITAIAALGALVVRRPLPAVGWGLVLALALVAVGPNLLQRDLRRRTPIWMIGVSERLGLTELNNTVGAAWGDANGDAWLDLYVSNHIPVTAASYLYESDGGRRFLRRRMAAGDYHGPGWCDIDNDGRSEVFVAGGNNTPVGPAFANMLFQHDGETWTDIAHRAGVQNQAGRAWGTAWADVDRDGLADLLVVDYFTPCRLFRNRGNRTFEDITVAAGIADVPPPTPTATGTRAASWADVDADGDLDLVLTALVTGLALYRNDTVPGTPPAVRFAEVAHDQGLHAAGPLGSEPEPFGLTGVAWGDYDNDLDLDLYVGSAYRNMLFRNRGDGSFEEVGAEAGVDEMRSTGGVAWGDLDNDGDLDLVVTVESNAGAEEPDARDLLYLNRGDGTFVDIAVAAGAIGYPDPKGQTLALADYDRDGWLDVLMVNQRIARGTRGSPRRWMLTNLLLRNASHRDGTPGHWLVVRLRGTVSNRDGIGARVYVRASGREQLREQNGGAHLFAQHGPELHFGLGDATRVDTVRVVWPSGIEQTLVDVAADRRLLIAEPQR